MLAQFTFKRTFNRISITIYVDCEKQQAEYWVKEDRLIRFSETIPFTTVRDPDQCQRWISRQIETGNGTLSFLEYLDWSRTRGVFPFERKVA